MDTTAINTDSYLMNQHEHAPLLGKDSRNLGHATAAMGADGDKLNWLKLQINHASSFLSHTFTGALKEATIVDF